MFVSIDSPVERPDAIGELFAGTLRAVTLRGIFAPSLLEEAARRLDAGEVSLPSVQVPQFRGRLLGRPLVAAQPDLRAYLDQAEQFRAGWSQLFPQCALDELLAERFAGLGGGRAVSVPSDQGSRYLAAGFRALVSGDALPFHCENRTFEHPAMGRLAPALDRATLMSFYVPVRLPPSGGELRIYEIGGEGEGSGLIERLGGDEAARPHFERGGWRRLEPAVGDLLLFDGGRYYHEITRVAGGDRWTLGGFLALTRDRREVRFWS